MPALVPDAECHAITSCEFLCRVKAHKATVPVPDRTGMQAALDQALPGSQAQQHAAAGSSGGGPSSRRACMRCRNSSRGDSSADVASDATMPATRPATRPTSCPFAGAPPASRTCAPRACAAGSLLSLQRSPCALPCTLGSCASGFPPSKLSGAPALRALPDALHGPQFLRRRVPRRPPYAGRPPPAKLPASTAASGAMECGASSSPPAGNPD